MAFDAAWVIDFEWPAERAQLASLHTSGSARWMAVRMTEWSSRVRPSFRNSTRTMYRVLPTA